MLWGVNSYVIKAMDWGAEKEVSIPISVPAFSITLGNLFGSVSIAQFKST